MIIRYSRARDKGCIFANIPGLSGILVWDVNVCREITAAPYIVFKCFNADVVRNISGPLLTAAAGA